jgi:hypothetical protein
MACAQICSDGCFQFCAQGRSERVAGGGHDEEEDAFVAVLRAAAPDAERVGEVGVEGGRFDDGVDLAAAEADSGGVFYLAFSVSIAFF